MPGPPRPQPARQGPTAAQAEVKAAYWQIFDDIAQPAGQAAVQEAIRRAEAFAGRYQRAYPAAVACLTSSLPELTVHLRLPCEHWQRIRHTNLLERTFGETRRRTKVIGRLPGERSCLKLVWAVLDRSSRGWRGLTYTPAATRLLQDLRRGLLAPPTDHADPKPVTTAAYHAHRSYARPPFHHERDATSARDGVPTALRPALPARRPLHREAREFGITEGAVAGQ